MKKIVGILIIALLASCKRESYLEPVEATPVFSMKGMLNGSPFTLAAGVDGVYMNSIAVQNNYGVYELNCEFLQTTCSGCEPLMEFQLNNNEAQSQGDPCDADVLEIGEIQLATVDNSSDFLEIHFHAPNQPGNDYVWDFGDSSTGNGDSPHHEYASPGLYTVTLSMENGWGPNDDVIITQDILVGTAEYISMPFNVINFSGDEWEFEYDNLPPHLEVVSWEINGVEYFGNDIHFNSDDEIHVCLNFVNTELNQTGSYCIQFNGDNNGQVSDFFSYQWEAQNMNFGKAECRYRSQDGNIYTSITPLNNNQNSFMEITSVEDYPEGLDGAAAKKVLARFSFWMVNTTNPDDIIHFEDVTTTLGFAIE